MNRADANAKYCTESVTYLHVTESYSQRVPRLSKVFLDLT